MRSRLRGNKAQKSVCFFGFQRKKRRHGFNIREEPLTDKNQTPKSLKSISSKRKEKLCKPLWLLEFLELVCSVPIIRLYGHRLHVYNQFSLINGCIQM